MLHTIRQYTSGIRCQSLIGVLVVLVFAKSLIPAGYMPASSESGMLLMLCSVDLPPQLSKRLYPELSSEAAPSGSVETEPLHEGCQFSGLSAPVAFVDIQGIPGFAAGPSEIFTSLIRPQADTHTIAADYLSRAPPA